MAFVPAALIVVPCPVLPACSFVFWPAVPVVAIVAVLLLARMFLFILTTEVAIVLIS